MAKHERLAWAEYLQKQLLQSLQQGTTVILLAGVRYRENLEPFLSSHAFSLEVPLAGLKLGQQLRRLKELSRLTP